LAEDSRPFLSGRRSIFTPGWFRKWAARWRDNVLDTSRLGQELFGEGYIALRYEDLLADPVHWMAQLWSFLGVDNQLVPAELILKEMGENPAAAWHSQKAHEIVRDLPRGKPGLWKAVFTDADRRTFHAIAEQALREWDYDLQAI
jgi:hypothetical protein